jgi:hypothetical protein
MAMWNPAPEFILWNLACTGETGLGEGAMPP